MGAQMAMLPFIQQLDAAHAAGGAAAVEAAFTLLARENSECVTSLKGGDLAGDMGWLKLPETKPGHKIPKDVAAKITFVRTVLNLEIGEISDIVISEDGVHLLKRSA